MPLTNFCSAKYARWYDALMAKARGRQLEKLNTELHHVRPRSLGGSDEESNLVRLTYREHFAAHWILTKICSGPDLRKMQFALFSMTLNPNGARIVSGWQYEVARRALYEPVQIAQARLENYRHRVRERELASFRDQFEAIKSGLIETPAGRIDLGELANKIAKYHNHVGLELPSAPRGPDEPIRGRRKPRRGKRARMRARLTEEQPITRPPRPSAAGTP